MAGQIVHLQNDLDSKALLNQFDHIIEQNLFPTNQFGDGTYSLAIDDTNAIPTTASFIFADVFINDLNNDHWIILFARDGDCAGDASSNAETGLGPVNDFNNRSQTAFLELSATGAGDSAFPRFGQWT